MGTPGMLDLSDQARASDLLTRMYSRKPRRKKRSRVDNNAALHKEWARLAPEILSAYLGYLAQDGSPATNTADLFHFTILVFSADGEHCLFYCSV